MTVAAAVVVSMGATLPATSAPSGTSATSPAGWPTSTCTPGAPSGQAMPVGDLPGWQQVFTDDFTTDVALGAFPRAVSDKWGASYPDGWPDTSGNGRYNPTKVVSVGRGMMNLHLHTESGVHMVAAPVPTVPGAEGSRGGQRYGRFVVRFRSDALAGYKTAWLLWPDSRDFPHDGEIDFPEGNLNGFVQGYVHQHGATSSGHAVVFRTTTTYTSWHTAVIEWTPTRITFLLDDTTVGTVTEGIPDSPMHWVLQTETSTSGPPAADWTSGDVQIDWVAVYKRAGTGAIPVPSGDPAPITAAAAKCAAQSAAASLVAQRVDGLRARGWMDITIDAPAAGQLSARLATKSDGRTVVLGTTRVALSRTGRTRVMVRLTDAARKLLRQRTAGLRADLTVTYGSGEAIGSASRAITFRAPLPSHLRGLHRG